MDIEDIYYNIMDIEDIYYKKYNGYRRYILQKI